MVDVCGSNVGLFVLNLCVVCFAKILVAIWLLDMLVDWLRSFCYLMQCCGVFLNMIEPLSLFGYWHLAGF